MRLNRTVRALRLIVAAAAVAFLQIAAAPARESGDRAATDPVSLDDSVRVQDVSAAVERHRLDFSADSPARGRAVPPVWRGEHPWFGLKLVNPTPLPLERLLMMRRPLLAGAGWSVGTSPALPHGPAVEWMGAAAPEPLPSRPGVGGAELFRLVFPGGASTRLAVPGAEGPVIASVLTQSAYGDYASFRFVILGLGFGLLGVLAALSLARWLGAGDRAAAASAGVGLSAVWVLATQFGHHLPLTGTGSGFDSGLKAAGLLLLAGALLFSVRMQVALPDRFLSVLTWSAAGCGALALAALPGFGVTAVAGPVLLAAALLSLAAAIADTVRHKSQLAMRLPDLASLSVLVIILAVAGVLAAGEPSVAADRWALVLHGTMIVALAVLGGSGLVLHHGVTVPLLGEYHPPEAEPPAPRRPSALGPEPAAADLAEHEIPAAAEHEAVPASAASETDRHRSEMIRDLRVAVAERGIHAVYQPVVDLKNGSVAGFEALARWEREGHGTVPPDAFIPLAEEAGLIDELGAQVLREAARTLGEWQRRYGGGKTPVRMSVNISARQLATPDLIETVRAVIDRERILPGTLTLELTEGVAIRDFESAAGRLQQLKTQGVLLALDDFGTGYSSLDYLRRLPFDIIKIDGSFLEPSHEERGRRIMEAVITLAHDLGMSVVAEGVEEARDIEKLRALGCDFAQGPFCGPPLAPAAAEAVLRRDRGQDSPSETKHSN